MPWPIGVKSRGFMVFGGIAGGAAGGALGAGLALPHCQSVSPVWQILGVVLFIAGPVFAVKGAIDNWQLFRTILSVRNLERRDSLK
jgi:hypothetical protein